MSLFSLVTNNVNLFNIKKDTTPVFHRYTTPYLFGVLMNHSIISLRVFYFDFSVYTKMVIIT